MNLRNTTSLTLTDLPFDSHFFPRRKRYDAPSHIVMNIGDSILTGCYHYAADRPFTSEEIQNIYSGYYIDGSKELPDDIRVKWI